MDDVKKILISPIKSDIANAFIRKHHYSGKVVNNSQLHLGAFWNNKLEGVMSFGCSLDKRKMIGLVKGTLWNEFLELNRMAFSEKLPRNSESRAIAIAMRIIRKQYPHIKWIVSFADGTQCGDGTIYRASGFILTGIHKNKNLALLPNGDVIHKMTLQSNPMTPIDFCGGKTYADLLDGAMSWDRFLKLVNGVAIKGFQIRYIYFLHPEEKENLTVPILPFSMIDEMKAGMYKGKNISIAERKNLICGTSINGNAPSFQDGDSVRVDCTAQLNQA